MKTINVALTQEAYENLKLITEETKANQSDVVSMILESTSVKQYKELLK